MAGLNQKEKKNFDQAIQEMTVEGMIKINAVVAGLEIQITHKGIEYIED